MNKQKVLKILNPVLGLLIAVQILGMTFADKLPIDPMAMYNFHKWNGWALGLILAAHVALNWSWVMANYFNRKKKG